LISGRNESDEKRLENLVYIELVRRYGRENISFGQDENGYEVDFIVKLEDQSISIQVCLQLNDDNSKREFGNLNLANKYLKGDGTVLYLDDLRKVNNSPQCQSVIEWLIKDN